MIKSLSWFDVWQAMHFSMIWSPHDSDVDISWNMPFADVWQGIAFGIQVWHWLISGMSLLLASALI